MTQHLIKKVHNGYEVDGLELLRKNCGCGGLTGPGGAGVGDCCLTYSTVKLEGNKVSFFSKGTTPNTTDNYEWGYRAKKGDMEVDVLVYDTRNKTNFEFGGSYAPPVSAWKDRGWEIVDQFERPLEGTGEKLAGVVQESRVLRAAGYYLWNNKRGCAQKPGKIVKDWRFLKMMTYQKGRATGSPLRKAPFGRRKHP